MSVATTSVGAAIARRGTPASASRAVTRREIAWGVTLALVLAVGIIGTLLLRTAMQSEARSLDLQRSQASVLQLKDQALQRELDRISNPASLAARAKALDMRQQVQPKFLDAKR